MARTKLEEFTLKEIKAMDEVGYHVNEIKKIAAKMADPKLCASLRMGAAHRLLGMPEDDIEAIEMVSMLYNAFNGGVN